MQNKSILRDRGHISQEYQAKLSNFYSVWNHKKNYYFMMTSGRAEVNSLKFA